MKYEAAIGYFEKKDYYRALQLYDQLIPIYRGTERAEKMAYYYAYCYYYQEDYIMGAYYFKRFAETYPRSQYAEECFFMGAYCNYLNSPAYSLDQTTTTDAIKDLQSFVNTYPTSDRVGRANELLDVLRAKLEMKAYNIANLYFNMEDYQAAIVSFQNLMKDYPDSPHREEVLFKIVESYYKYADKSFAQKQEERFQAVISSYNDLKALYPESKYLKQGESFSRSASSKIALLNKSWVGVFHEVELSL